MLSIVEHKQKKKKKINQYKKLVIGKVQFCVARCGYVQQKILAGFCRANRKFLKV